MEKIQIDFFGIFIKKSIKYLGKILSFLKYFFLIFEIKKKKWLNRQITLI